MDFCFFCVFFFFNDTATTEIYTLSLHDALPISFAGYLGEDRPAHREGLGRPLPVAGEGGFRLALGVQEENGGAPGRGDGEDQFEEAPGQRLRRAEGVEILGRLEERREVALRPPLPGLCRDRRGERGRLELGSAGRPVD